MGMARKLFTICQIELALRLAQEFSSTIRTFQYSDLFFTFFFSVNG